MDLLKELEQYLEELKKFKKAMANPDSIRPKKERRNFLDSALESRYPQKSNEDLIKELREHLMRKSGAYSNEIIKLSGKKHFFKGMIKYDMWEAAFNPRLQCQEIALEFCINNTIVAIGKLEAENKVKEEKTIGRLLFEEPKKSVAKTSPKNIEPPKAFIAHEGETRALTILKEFLEALGIQYYIAEVKASDGRSIEKQVDWTQSKADFAICLATKGKAINKKTGKHFMAPNIADELGRARVVFKNKVILLEQKGVEPHSNIKEIVHEKFTSSNMEKAFIKIAKELTNWGYITSGISKEPK